jgi:hypothetical protein
MKKGPTRVGPLLTPLARNGMLSKGPVGANVAPITDKASVSPARVRTEALFFFVIASIRPRRLLRQGFGESRWDTSSVFSRVSELLSRASLQSLPDPLWREWLIPFVW